MEKLLGQSFCIIRQEGATDTYFTVDGLLPILMPQDCFVSFCSLLLRGWYLSLPIQEVPVPYAPCSEVKWPQEST